MIWSRSVRPHAHGAGLSVLFPAWANYVCLEYPEKFAQFAVRVRGCRIRAAGRNLPGAGIAALKDYFRSLGMPTTMGELEIPPESYPQIADLTTENGTKTCQVFAPCTGRSPGHLSSGRSINGPKYAPKHSCFGAYCLKSRNQELDHNTQNEYSSHQCGDPVNLSCLLIPPLLYQIIHASSQD